MNRDDYIEHLRAELDAAKETITRYEVTAENCDVLRAELAAPAPVPDAGYLEILIAAQVNEAYHERKTITEAAQAIVSALQAGAMVVPDDYALVPIEPTPEMFFAVSSAIGMWLDEVGDETDIYKAMLAASPSAKGGE